MLKGYRLLRDVWTYRRVLSWPLLRRLWTIHGRGRKPLDNRRACGHHQGRP